MQLSAQVGSREKVVCFLAVFDEQHLHVSRTEIAIEIKAAFSNSEAKFTFCEFGDDL